MQTIINVILPLSMVIVNIKSKYFRSYKITFKYPAIVKFKLGCGGGGLYICVCAHVF